MALTKEEREELREKAATTAEQVEQYLANKAKADLAQVAQLMASPPDPSKYQGRPEAYTEAKMAHEEAVRQAQRDAHDARTEARSLAEQEQMKAQALRNYTQAGGLAKDFETQWPKIRDRLLLERTVRRMGTARSGLRYRL